jgi:predicted double-glycine peptidase
MFVGDPLEGAKDFKLWRFKEGWRWEELEEDSK